ncbi:MAG: leucine-rich repeat domain-containing protein [Treponema sp.]|nr:leucine-rich repeat domain-containing protein [Treponema sp.]
MSVAVLVPEGKGLADGEAYLPALVQGVLVGDFTKFSAMKVLDRQNLEKVIAEGESGYYTDESGFVQLGTVAKVQYILNGALQKTGSGFSLQLKVTDAASGESKAAYTGNVPAAELENLTGVKKASADLLAQLGVSLTDAGKTGLLGRAASNVQAETALAKGITAQRSGTIVEALSYYYEAAKFDPGLAEAASRSSVLSADIAGGNIGQNVRNDIQARSAWNKTFQEAAAFFKERPPLELIYDPALAQGKIDYTRETAEMSFEAKLIGTTGLKIIYDLDQGLKKNANWKDWGISVDSIFQAIPQSYEFNAALINEAGETIGKTAAEFSFFPGLSVDFSHIDAAVSFSNVDANKISDKLTVSIVSVNGRDAKNAGERGYMSISTEDFASFPPLKFRWWCGDIKITGSGTTRGDVVIPSKIGRWSVTSIEKDAFNLYDGMHTTSITIPDSVTSIGYRALTSGSITSITIPANMNLDSEYIVLPEGCYSAYLDNRRKAGTYVKQRGKWVLR